MTIKRVSVYDMDGTIVCSLHRYKTQEKEGRELIDLAYWRANEYRAKDDSLLPLAAQYQEDLNNPEVYVIIATARVLHDTDKWFIDKILGKPDFVISRKDGDTRGGADLKIKGLQRFFNLVNFPDYRKWVFYEDNAAYLKSVCDKFKIRGVYIPSQQGH